MIKKTITYTDLNGEAVTEDHFFHLTKANLVELEMSKKGGFAKMLEKMIADEDGPTIMAEFKKLVLMSYGKKSDDGRTFIKNQELTDAFAGSEAYSELFMQLVTDAEAASAFVNGIVPSGMGEQLKAQVEKKADPQPRTISRAEMITMSNEELTAGLMSGEMKLAQE